MFSLTVVKKTYQYCVWLVGSQSIHPSRIRLFPCPQNLTLYSFHSYVQLDQTPAFPNKHTKLDKLDYFTKLHSATSDTFDIVTLQLPRAFKVKLFVAPTSHICVESSLNVYLMIRIPFSLV